MNFGEKLFSLRKEKGLSQEALAEQLNTSRQAVSKWENNQGYPETEKLLMLANLFEVSVDYLLKESPSDISSDGQGLYVSRSWRQAIFCTAGKWAVRSDWGSVSGFWAAFPIRCSRIKPACGFSAWRCACA